MAKKSPMSRVGGVLVFLGSLIYLYIVFGWYASGSTTGSWLTAAQFLSPFVAAIAVVSAISLFFMGIGAMTMPSNAEKMSKILWKFVMVAAITLLIIIGSGSLVYFVLIGFILTYIGAMLADKM